MAPKNPAAILVSFGPEDFFLDRDIENARSWAGRKTVMVDGEDMPELDLVGELEMQLMDAVPRTFIIDNAQKYKGDRGLKKYLETKPLKDFSVIIQAVIRSEKLPEMWSAASRREDGKIAERKSLETWKDRNQVIPWIEKEAARHNATLDAGVAANLFTMVGSDLYRLSNELKKLALVAGERSVTREHLKLIVAPSPVANQFQIADAAMAKNPISAMNSFSIMYKNEGDDALVPITSALMRQIEKALIARSMLDKGVKADDVAVAVGMKPWPFSEYYLPVVRKHDVRSLVRHMSRLCKLDVEIKGAARSKRTLVELAVLAIAG